MICFPNAKINLGLHITEKRPDGFHNIETVFYPVGLCDALEIIPSEREEVEFSTSGIVVQGDPGSNLVLKAVKLISDAHNYPTPGPSPTREGSKPPLGGLGVLQGMQIHLHKVIPAGAGLGGGSSDAAYTLKLLNDLWQLKLSVPQLKDLARKLGSDCAFFIENRPVFATGRGDHFESIDLDLSGYQIIVTFPPVHISTPEAYGMVSPRKPESDIKEIVRMPVETWRDNLFNDFEEPVMKKYPVIREFKEELYRRGAVYAAMSGSGSAVYGLFTAN